MEVIDEETKARYDLVAEKLICPQCGNDVQKTNLGEMLKRLEELPEPGEDLSTVAYVCSHPECIYCIAIGEQAA